MAKYNEFEYGSSLYGTSSLQNIHISVFTSKEYELEDITGSDITVKIMASLPIVKYYPFENDQRFCVYSGDWAISAQDTIDTTDINATCVFKNTGRSLKLYFVPSSSSTYLTVTELKRDRNGVVTESTYDLNMFVPATSGSYAVASIDSDEFAYRELTISKKTDDGVSVGIYCLESIAGEVTVSILLDQMEYTPLNAVYENKDSHKEIINIIGESQFDYVSEEIVYSNFNIGTFEKLRFRAYLISGLYTPFISNNMVFPTILDSIGMSGQYELKAVDNGQLITTIALDPDTFKSYGNISWITAEPEGSQTYFQTQSSSDNDIYSELTAPYTTDDIVCLTDGSTEGTYTSDVISATEYQIKLYKLKINGWDCTDSNKGYNYALGDRMNNAYVIYSILVLTNDEWLSWPQGFRFGENLISSLNTINTDIKIKMDFYRENSSLPTPYCNIGTSALVYNMQYQEEIQIEDTVSAVMNNNTGIKPVGSISSLGFTIPVELQYMIDNEIESPLVYTVSNTTGVDYIDAYFDMGDKFYSTNNDDAELVLQCIENESNTKHYQFEHGRIINPNIITNSIHSSFYPPINGLKNYEYYLCSGWINTDTGKVDPYSDPNIAKDENGNIIYTDGEITYRRTIDIYWYGSDGNVPDDPPSTWDMNTQNAENRVVVYIYDTDQDNIGSSWRSQEIVYNNNRINNNQKQQINLTMTVELPALIPNLIGNFDDIYKVDIKPGSVKCNHYASPDTRIKIKNFEIVFDPLIDIYPENKHAIIRGEKLPLKDSLPIYGVVSIDGVYDNIGGLVPDYTEGIDYELDTENNCIIWGLDNQDAKQPEIGETYYVTLRYRRPRYGIVVFECDYTEKIESNVEFFSRYYITRDGSVEPGKVFTDHDLPYIRYHYTPAISSVTCGNNHAFIIDINNRAWGFGNNESGQLGINKTAGYEPYFNKIDNVTWKMIACGFNHTIGITTSGDLYAWGDNTFGQIGDGTTTDKHYPVKISDKKFKFAAAGKNTSFAIDNNNELWGWGDNSFNQLLSNLEYSVVPINIDAANVVKISVYNNSVAIIDTNNNLYTWGENTYGQLGSGDTINQPNKLQIVGRFKDVAMGGTHCVACDINNNIYATGNNEFFQLGSSEGYTLFTLINNFGEVKDTDTVSLACGYDHTAVIRNNTLYLCGKNSYAKISNKILNTGHQPFIASNKALKVAAGDKITIVTDTLKHMIVYSDTVDAKCMKNMAYEYPKWEIDNDFYNIFPDMFDTNMSLKILPDSLRYTIYDNNKYINSKIDYDLDKNPYVIATTNTAKANLNWNPLINSGYYFEGKERYYLYSEPGKLILNQYNYPTSNKITFDNGAIMSDIDSYISYPFNVSSIPSTLYFNFTPYGNGTIFEITDNNNSISLKYNNGTMIFSVGDEQFTSIIDLLTGSHHIFLTISEASNIIIDNIIYSVCDVKLYIDEYICTIIEAKENINNLLSNGYIVLGNNAGHNEGMNCKVTNLAFLNKCLIEDEVSFYVSQDFPQYNQNNIIFRNALVYNIIDYENFFASIPIPKQNAPVTIEDESNTYMQVSFIEDGELKNYSVFNTIYKPNNNKKLYLPCQELDPEFDTVVMAEGVPIPIELVLGNTITLGIENDEELIDKTINIIYQPRNNFFIDYTDYNSAMISMSSRPENETSIIYESSDDPYYLIQMLDLNPMLNPNNNGFVYISNTPRITDAISVNISPQQINIDPHEHAVVIIDALDKTGNPTSLYDLYVDAKHGKIMPFINSVNLKDPYEYELYKTFGSMAGRSCFIYTPPTYDELEKNMFKKKIPSKVLNFNSANIIGKWNLDGNTEDSSGNERHAINHGATLNNDLNYVFDYKDKIISTNISTGNNCTVMASAYTEYGGVLFSLNSYNGPDLWWSGNNIYWSSNDSSANIFTLNGIPVDMSSYKNGWHHFTVVNNRSTNTATLFIDGEFVGIANHRNTVQENRLFGIGCSISSGLDSWKGMIKDVVLFNSALSPEEIGIIYNEVRNENYYSSEEILEYKVIDYITIIDRVSNKGIVKPIDLIGVKGGI